MLKRLSLLLAALFVAATLFAAPVFATGNDNWNNKGDDNDKVCVRYKDDDGNKHYRWIHEEDKEHGDKVVKDKFCKKHKKDDDKDKHAKKDDDNNDKKDKDKKDKDKKDKDDKEHKDEKHYKK